MTWLTQAFAMVTLWACSVYLYKNKRNYFVAIIPAVFMTMVSITYILQAKEGFRLNLTVSNIISSIVTAICIVIFVTKMKGYKAVETKSEELKTTNMTN